MLSMKHGEAGHGLAGVGKRGYRERSKLHPTFETDNGRSLINITLTRNATVESWMVREEENLAIMN